ncbi:hypothetical protein DPMN_123314 [Dreissena polymorpha]|uniref:Uncharacterized protein n=1 Tax=Dreissena polymorpha TaxID=45954 RepID=A0A9D4GU28_DREPO|nr:hypothetical protein DPMN_123314 [Dreissena polymorpha]
MLEGYDSKAQSTYQAELEYRCVVTELSFLLLDYFRSYRAAKKQFTLTTPINM